VTTVGVIGLGNMGSVLAGNLVGAGFDVVTHDRDGASTNPGGARFVDSIAEVASSAETIALSLPDGRASLAVAEAVVATERRRAELVIDLSTTGPRAAEAVGRVLTPAGVAHVDAPVSGGPGGARARTLMIMYAGTDAACASAEPVLAGFSDHRRRVGDRAGLAQAMKLVNNVLAATALAATSEAVAFGLDAGLELETMLDVLNASSGRNDATVVKFPQQVVTGRYAHGFANTLMAKDVDLFLEEAAATGGAGPISSAVVRVWQGFAAEHPDVDFTRIFSYLRGSDVP